MSPILQLIVDLVALAQTPQGQAVIKDVEVLLGVAPPAGSALPTQPSAALTDADRERARMEAIIQGRLARTT